MRSIDRRSLVKAGTAAPFLCPVISIFAQTANMDKEKLPFRSINLANEGKMVAIFFDFTCPFSAKYHPTLIRWMSTVPKTVRVIQFPVVNIRDKEALKEQVTSAKCFYAAATLCSSAQLQIFVSSLYETRQQFINSIGALPIPGQMDQQVSPLSLPSTWINAAKAAAINQTIFHRLVTSSTTTEQTRLAARKLIDYQIIETPSIGIGGRYVMSPDSANGDQEMFFNLLNGLVSEIV